MKEYPNYYSITPATVRYDNRLKANEKLLFGEITALSNIKGYCYSTNKYFSKLYDVSITTISTWINHLKELGYIKVEMIKEGKEIKERHLFPVVEPIKENLNTPIKEKFKRGIKENFKENNTSINNTRINNTTTTTAFVEYQKMVGVLSPNQNIVLSDYIQRLSDDVVKFAINVMVDATTTPNFNYLNRILMRYEDLGINTVEKAEALEKEHQAKKKPKKKTVKRQSKPSEEWGGW